MLRVSLIAASHGPLSTSNKQQVAGCDAGVNGVMVQNLTVVHFGCIGAEAVDGDV